MSLLDIARSRGRHRGLASAELRSELDAVSRQKDAATIAAIRYATEATELQQQLDKAGITISGLLHDLGEAQREIDGLRAALANATSVHDLHLHPAVAETQPIPVLPLHLSPLAGTSPSHIPGA